MVETTDALGRVLIVGTGDAATELAAQVRDQSWACAHSDAPSGVLPRLHAELDIDVVVLTPGAAFHPYGELCRQIKLDSRTALVPVVFALTPAHMERRAEAYQAGADDCLQLPAPPTEIAVQLSRAGRMKRATDSLEDATAVISSLANAVEGRDHYTRGHVERVGMYATAVGRQLGVTTADLVSLRLGGIVHDIGKVAVPDQVLNKPGPLTDAELAVVKRHPLVGFDILKPCRSFRNVLPIVRWHHERPNGAGYPDGLGGRDLPLLPRIVAVVDVFDALSTTRAYRPALTPPQYTALLRQAAARGDLDSSIVNILLSVISASAPAPALTPSAERELSPVVRDSR
jgi:putative two-component system response regulator